ncbi:hypothetical protein BDV30DRAFT_202704 [Aspergillus minisclerotigenes]|uniref:Uncharacterized protein n=1 Tax=Aspergillus minisclerotigenes TaxID=656917 RepID=A0A5N6JLM9_9EURO|nr:hypothetical protein BDV30DRAFT_202704 [Aspergillus minisclerotigenes]
MSFIGHRPTQGKNLSVEPDGETPLSTTSFSRPSQAPSFTSNEISMLDEPHTMNPSQLTTPEKRLYDFLYSQGWTGTQCSSYFAHIEAIKEALSHYFYSQAWSDDQVQALHERCQMELPENIPAPRGDAAQEDLQMHLRLVEKLNRRKAIGERMYPSTRTVGMGLLSREGLEVEFPQSIIIMYIHLSSLGHISGSLAIFSKRYILNT